MQRLEVEARILMILKKLIDKKEVTDELIQKINYKETNLLDSLKFISLILKLEQEFDIEIDDDDLLIDNFSEFGKIVDYIERKLN